MKKKNRTSFTYKKKNKANKHTKTKQNRTIRTSFIYMKTKQNKKKTVNNKQKIDSYQLY